MEELEVHGGSRLECALREPSEVDNDTENVLDDRDICRDQFALRKVSDAMVVGTVLMMDVAVEKLRTRSRDLNPMISFSPTSRASKIHFSD